MRNNSWLITVIFIVLTLLVFGFGGAFKFVNSPPGSLDGYILIVSFMGLFATFGGAYMGAKVSGEYSIKSFEKQIEWQNNDYKIKSESKKNILLNNLSRDIKKSNIGETLILITFLNKWDNQTYFTLEDIEIFEKARDVLDGFTLEDMFFYLSETSKNEVFSYIHLLDNIITINTSLKVISNIELPEENKIIDKLFNQLKKYLNDLSIEIKLQNKDIEKK